MRALVAAGLLAAGFLQGPPAVPASRATTIVGQERVHAAGPGDSWQSLGARHGVAADVLARRNGRTLRTPIRLGEIVTIDNRHIVPAALSAADVVVNVPQRMVFVGQAQSVAAYPVAVGKADWPTPIGPFTIVELETDPTWDVPESIQEEMRREGKRVLTSVPPGPDNPLGQYWIRTSFPGVGLHGTNAPLSIYRAVTHGCMRLHPDDIALLFAAVQAGTPGRIVYEPLLATVSPDGRVWLEVHEDVYRRRAVSVAEARRQLDAIGAIERADEALVAAAVKAREGIAVDVTRASSLRRER